MQIKGIKKLQSLLTRLQAQADETLAAMDEKRCQMEENITHYPLKTYDAAVIFMDQVEGIIEQIKEIDANQLEQSCVK